MKALCVFIAIAFQCVTAFADIIDSYTLTLTASVPQVYNNFQSQGERRFKTQKIVGTINVVYSDAGKFIRMEGGSFVNKTQKTSTGGAITYTCNIDDTQQFVWNYIGDNKKNVFKTTTVMFNMTLEPSYVASTSNDDTLIVALSGAGKYSKRFGSMAPSSLKGTGAGQLGCGCAFYGHTSPTRTATAFGPDLNDVVDIAALKQVRWTMKLKTRRYVK